MLNRKIILSAFTILAVFFIICLIYAHYEYTQLKVKTIEVVSAGHLCEIQSEAA